MLLRPSMKVNAKKVEPKKEEKKVQSTKNGAASAGTKKEDKKLPPDTYKPILEGLEIQVSDTKKLVFSVNRKGEDGLPHVDIREYVMTDIYTGLTKKGVNFDIEYLDEVIEMLQKVSKECEKKGV